MCILGKFKLKAYLLDNYYFQNSGNIIICGIDLATQPKTLLNLAAVFVRIIITTLHMFILGMFHLLCG